MIDLIGIIIRVIDGGFSLLPQRTNTEHDAGLLLGEDTKIKRLWIIQKIPRQSELQRSTSLPVSETS